MDEKLSLELICIKKPQDLNFILGQSHFIKTVEDLYETIISSTPNAKFGIAFCEASGACKVRSTGNDESLQKLAEDNAMQLQCGHCFIIMMENIFPINILNAVKNVPEVCTIFCATANPTQVVVAQTNHEDGQLGRGILGVIDGYTQTGVETTEDIAWRHDFLRSIGYKQ